MAQQRFGIELNNGKAISGAGVVLLIISFLVFFPMAVAAFVLLATERITLETVATALGLLLGPGLVIFSVGLLFLKLLGVPFIRPIHEVADLALLRGQPDEAKLWWVWRVFAGIMGTGLIVAGGIGLVDGNTQGLLLWSIGFPALIYVAILGRDV